MKGFIKSKGLLVFNLVFFGVLFGFTLALGIFSCSTAVAPSEQARAEDVNEIHGEALSLQSSFRTVAQKALPVVVKLDVTEVRNAPDYGNGDIPFFEYFFGDQPEGNGEGREYRSEGLGSGVIIRKDGNTYYVLTNDHVVGEADTIYVNLYDQRRFEGRLIGADPRKDLALVSFETDDSDIPVAPIGNSDDLFVGDWVLAVGSPFGFESSVTAGIVSALHRRGGPAGNISDFIQTDAAINQGNSGGALVNLKGEVIGINTWITTTTGGNMGLGFAIPINNAKKAIDDFINKGEVQYGWLGVSINDVPEPIRTDLDLGDRKGAFVNHVFQDSPAGIGGILPGDFITSVNDLTITSSDELTQYVGDLPVGEQAVFKLIRNGKQETVTVIITAREKEAAIQDLYSTLWPGFQVFPITEELKSSLKLDDGTEGVVIVQVQAKSPAAIGGLRSGDIIFKINNESVKNISDFYRALNKNTDNMMFYFLRDGVKLSQGIMK